MKINPFHHTNNLAFKGARLNILATSDNHGNSHSVPLLAETIKHNVDDIFINSKDKSTLNIFAIAGDWFINPSKKGYLTNPEMTNGDIQNDFLNNLISYVKALCGKRANFDAIFTLGNHDLDAGDKFIYQIMKDETKKTLITNVDVANSKGIQQVQEETDAVQEAIVYEIKDDKNPKLSHKVLFLGVTIPSMQFYNPGLLENMEFFGDSNKKDSNITRSDLEQTIQAVKKHVDKFKEENPKGAVILLSHTGATISKLIRDEVPQINVILNGHDHKNLTSLKGKTNIQSLGKDNEIIKSLNLTFDNEGNLETIDMNSFFSKATEKDTLESNPLYKFLKKSFEKDLISIVCLSDAKGNPAELQYGDLIRYQNSYLANYLTSAVKRSVREISQEDDVIVGIPSSIIRGGLKNGSNNLDIMKIFDGVSENLSSVHMGSVTGEELVGLIFENVRDNIISPKRNTIIQWSDIQINKTLIENIINGKSKKAPIDAIKVRSSESKDKFIPVEKDKKYRIALGKKYLIKDDLEWPKKIRHRFIDITYTYDELFRMYIESEEVKFNLIATDKTKENRIL